MAPRHEASQRAPHDQLLAVHRAARFGALHPAATGARYEGAGRATISPAESEGPFESIDPLPKFAPPLPEGDPDVDPFAIARAALRPHEKRIPCLVVTEVEKDVPHGVTRGCNLALVLPGDHLGWFWDIAI